MNAEVRHIKTSAEATLADVFAAAQPVLPGDAAIAAARLAAFDTFAATGLPHRRVEAWKYTDLRALMRDAQPLAGAPDEAAKAHAQDAGAVIAEAGCRRLVVVDGTFAPDLSDLAELEAGLSVGSMAQALASGDALVSAHLGKVFATQDAALALNTALMGDGVVIHVAADVVPERPLHVVFVTTGDKPSAMFVRSLVVVERGGRAMLIETHEGPQRVAYQINTALELAVGDDAQLERIRINQDGDGALHVATLLASLGARAKFDDFSFTTGASITRNQLFVRFVREGATASLRGASLLADRQHADSTLVVDHAAAGCESRELFKSVLDGEASSVFQGRITVRPQAQRTDARMMTRALLLSEAAEADAKPELEIFADDVQCGHGATTGALDEEAKFYLMARGMPAKEAEALLVQSFVGEAIDAIGHEVIKQALTRATTDWLQERR
jgi:Fe-S cluster assembly protein SufD